VNPTYFGPAASPLYGVYHPPRADSGKALAEGVLLCSAFGQEYMRSHRAYRQLSLLLTRKGFHVLRFDYRGTGDSAGDMNGVTAAQWLDDVGIAIDELRESTGVQRVSVLGLRLGALIAGVACAARTDVARLVLWDPVESGAAYEAELRAAIAAERPTPYEAPSGNGESADGTLHFNGFPLPAALRDSLRTLDLSACLPLGVPRVLQAVSHEAPSLSRLRDQLRAHPGFRYQYTPAPHDWNYVDHFGGILLPQPVIQAIVNWFDAEART
jgi:pimeloyl-ACP methyl ester carboxylesterase